MTIFLLTVRGSVQVRQTQPVRVCSLRNTAVVFSLISFSTKPLQFRMYLRASDSKKFADTYCRFHHGRCDSIFFACPLRMIVAIIEINEAEFIMR
jgi:hypothetical protein